MDKSPGNQFLAFLDPLGAAVPTHDGDPLLVNDERYQSFVEIGPSAVGQSALECYTFRAPS
jgi:hypothetical protein